MDNKKEAVKRELEKIAHEMEGLTFKPHLPVSTCICTYVHTYVPIKKKSIIRRKT
jgi:hypothetical protein